jgi:hypothetical protein
MKGIGLTFTVTGVEEAQPLAVAVIINVLVCGTFVLLPKLPVIVGPDPVVGIPTTVATLSLVQLKTVPYTLFGFVLMTGLIDASEQIAWAKGVALTEGTGFTITFALAYEKHPFAVAAIMNIDVCGILLLLVNVPLIVVPVPLEGIPVRLVTLFLLQVNTVFGTLFGLVLMIWVIGNPEQIV